MCFPADFSCRTSEGLQEVVADAFRRLSLEMGKSALESLHAVSTFWVKIESPNLGTANGDQWTDSGPVGFLHQHVVTVSTAVFTLAVLVAGTRIAWEQRAEPLRQLLKATLLFIVVSAAGTATLQLLADWSDKFAVDLVNQAVPDDQTFDAALGNAVMPGTAETTAQQLPLVLYLSAAGVVLIASLIQVVLLLIRSAMLVLLAATFPLAAAATNTEVGRSWFKKYCGWALAFIAYKPAAALIYAAAIKMSEAGMTARSGNQVVQVLTGLMMLLLAIFALPALLRFAVPVTAAVAGGGSAMGGAVADPGGLASGAVNVGRSFVGGSSGGGSSHAASSSGGPSGSGPSGGGSSGGGSSRGASSAGSRAGGAARVGATAGLAAAGAAITAAKQAGGALAGAASHSAGEPAGGTTTSGSSRPRTPTRNSPPPPTPHPPGPTGST